VLPGSGGRRRVMLIHQALLVRAVGVVGNRQVTIPEINTG
jgi:hypothetical protein